MIKSPVRINTAKQPMTVGTGATAISDKRWSEGELPDDAASIPKFGLEIKNRCTQERVNGENLASIPKSGLEIKNQCTQKGKQTKPCIDSQVWA